MTKKQNAALLLVTLALLSAVLAGCGGSMNTVETCVLANEQYTEKDALESAEQTKDLKASQDIYASVRFIESPLGMAYTGSWYMDDMEIKTETRKTTRYKSDIIIFSLEADKATPGTVRFEIVYGDDVLFTKELSVQ